MPSYERDGYEIHRGVLHHDELEPLRCEADRLAREAGATCIRHLRSRSARIDLLATDRRIARLVPTGLACVRSILFDKTPESNWPVSWHQDLTIAVRRKTLVSGYGPWSVKDGVAHVQPPIALLSAMATVRIHLDDADDENGALRVAPGTHRLGKVDAGSLGLRFDDEAVTCCCFAGDCLTMSPLLLHSSRRSLRPGRRRVLHFEFAPPEILDNRLQWHERA